MKFNIGIITINNNIYNMLVLNIFNYYIFFFFFLYNINGLIITFWLKSILHIPKYRYRIFLGISLKLNPGKEFREIH